MLCAKHQSACKPVQSCYGMRNKIFAFLINQIPLDAIHHRIMIVRRTRNAGYSCRLVKQQPIFIFIDDFNPFVTDKNPLIVIFRWKHERYFIILADQGRKNRFFSVQSYVALASLKFSEHPMTDAMIGQNSFHRCFFPRMVLPRKFHVCHPFVDV